MAETVGGRKAKGPGRRGVIVVFVLAIALLVALLVFSCGCGEKKAVEEKETTTEEETTTDKNEQDGDESDEGTEEEDEGEGLTETYYNERFGFSISYPGGWSASESANGDGCTLSVPGQQKDMAYAWASHDIDGRSMKEILDDYAEEIASLHGEPTRDPSKLEEGTLQGAEYITDVWTYNDSLDGTLMKEIILYMSKDNVVYGVSAVYPNDQASEIGSTMTNVVKSFTLPQ